MIRESVLEEETDLTEDAVGGICYKEEQDI
jgi:hypothetical protein